MFMFSNYATDFDSLIDEILEQWKKQDTQIYFEQLNRDEQRVLTRALIKKDGIANLLCDMLDNEKLDGIAILLQEACYQRYMDPPLGENEILKRIYKADILEAWEDALFHAAAKHVNNEIEFCREIK